MVIYQYSTAEVLMQDIATGAFCSIVLVYCVIIRLITFDRVNANKSLFQLKQRTNVHVNIGINVSS